MIKFLLRITFVLLLHSVGITDVHLINFNYVYTALKIKGHGITCVNSGIV